MIEEYKDIKGYEGLYQVSSLGNIKSLSRKAPWKNSFITIKESILNPFITGKNYLTVRMYKNKTKKGFRVHQLVAITFLGHKPSGMRIVVDHINNIKTDNRAINLQLISNRENASKDKVGFTSKYTGVSWSKTNKKWHSQIRINSKQKSLGYFINELDASNKYQSVLKTL